MNYKQRRQQIFNAMQENEMCLFFAGKPVRSSADGEFPFEVNRNYQYLAGMDEPEGILCLSKRKDSKIKIVYIVDINWKM